MSNQNNIPIHGAISKENLPFYYLLLAGLIQFLFIICSSVAYDYLDHYTLIPCMLFLGVVFSKKMAPSAMRNLWLGMLMVGWFIVIQVHNTFNGIQSRPVGLFFTPYLMAFPFAALTQDGNRQKGLKSIFAVYLIGSLILVIYTVLLLLDCLPSPISEYTFWDGARLRAVWYPNTCACIFLIGVAVSIGFSFQVRKRWIKGLLLTAAALCYFATALTNSRTIILMVCVFICGTLFFRFWKGGLIRFFAYSAGALVVVMGLFFAASNIYDIHSEILVNKYTTQMNMTEGWEPEVTSPLLEQSTVFVNENGEIELQGNYFQDSLANDIWTFNGRTGIWESAYYAIVDNPSILIWGISNPGALISNYNSFLVYHAHNSWVELLLLLGIPALLIALIFTGMAVWNALVILFQKNDMWKKCIALMVLCLLVGGVMEPTLFIGYRLYPFFDFIFFLCLGYMIQWRKTESC